MKKVLFSLLMAFVCLPMAFGQAKGDLVVRTIDTTVCGSLTWNGHLYTADTVLLYLSGDTAFVVNVTIDTGSVTTNETVVACGQYTAPWNEILTESGDYGKDTIINGCERHDSVHLTINPVFNAPLEQVTAECAYTWYGQVITDSEIHTHALPTAGGCDSILSLQVTSFTHQVTTYDTVVACGQYVAPWQQTLTASGEYEHRDTTNGCETIANLKLTVNPAYTDTASVNVDQITTGCYYVWHGQTYNDTNVDHYTTVQTAAGCDSLIAMRIVTYTGHQYDTTNVEYCGYRYEGWFGKKFENPDIPTPNSPAALRDSVFLPTLSGTVFIGDTVIAGETCTMHHHLNLTFVHDFDTVEKSGCTEYTYTFDSRIGATQNENVTYTESGEYDTDLNGVLLYSRHWSTYCYKIHHLSLNVLQPEQRERDSVWNIVACDKYNFKYGTIQFQATSDTAFTAIRHYNQIAYGQCHDSIVNVNIVIPHSTHRDTTVITCDTFTWAFNGQLYTHSGTYNQKIADTTNSQGCDSIGQLRLTINRTPEVSIEGNWNLLPGETANLSANCSEANVTFKWYTNNNSTPASTDATFNVTPNGDNVDVRLETTKKYGAHSCVANNWITVTSGVGIDQVENLQVNLYPNPTSRVLNVQSEGGISEVVIYNAIGQQVLRQHGHGELLQLDLGSLASGSYTISINGVNGDQAKRKINVSK